MTAEPLSRNDPRHGTPNGYKNLGCRCDRCREATTEHHRSRGTAGYATDLCECGSKKKAVSSLCQQCYVASVSVGHGIESRYTKGCRCDECRLAASRARARRRAAGVAA